MPSAHPTAPAASQLHRYLAGLLRAAFETCIALGEAYGAPQSGRRPWSGVRARTAETAYPDIAADLPTPTSIAASGSGRRRPSWTDPRTAAHRPS